MNVAYYYSLADSSIDDLSFTDEVSAQRLLSVLGRLHYALTRMGYEMAQDNQYDAAITGVQRTVMFLENWIRTLTVLNQHPPVSQMVRQIKRSLAFVPIVHIDYEEIRTRTQWLRQELAEYLFHPVRVENWIKQGEPVESYMP